MVRAAGARRLALERLLEEPVDWRYKGFPPGPPVALGAIGGQGWNVLGGDFTFPVMLLRESALRHNLAVVHDFCGRSGLALAPHGKTHMSPQLLQMQLEAGAWGVTVANVSQARVYRAFGADRMILANQLVDEGSVAWVAGELATPGFELLCLVDSPAGVQAFDQALGEHRPARRLSVLLELGVPGGRAGCRTAAAAHAVAEAVARSRCLALVGVEAFEGVIHGASDAETLAAVDGFLAGFRDIVGRLDEAGSFAMAETILVSAGGSAYPDRVAQTLNGDWELSRPVTVVLRSGCYLTHDAGHYRHLSPFGGRLPDTQPLEDALELWAPVLSRPEPGLAIVGFGKRDAPYDLGLPVPRTLKRSGDAVRPLDAEVFALNDQHAYLRSSDSDIRVGDLVGCGISHPCTAFDKWRLIPVVDDGYGVLDAVLTFF